MSAETLMLYHSTDRAGLEAAQREERLYGRQITKPHVGFSGGSNLTTDKRASREFIVCYKSQGQWREEDGPPELFTLTFSVPVEHVVSVGTTHLFGCNEFATALTVDAREVPDEYLEKQHAGMHPMTRAHAQELQDQGKIRFYQVPWEFLQSIEPVEFTWRGVTYPLSSSA